MSDLVKKINFPQTSIVKDEDTRRYARKLTRVLDDLKKLIDMNLEQNVTNITNIISEMDHGNLLGLQDVEDHLYAFLHNATRAFTAHGPGFHNDVTLSEESQYSAVSEYAIKAYVDALLAYILASPLGSIIYIWHDNEGNKKLERLIPGEYGQVLVTAGEDQRPFWDWIWMAPGGEGAPAIHLYLVVESSYSIGIITIDNVIETEKKNIGSYYCSNLGPHEEWFKEFNINLSSAKETAKITPEKTIEMDVSGDIGTFIVFGAMDFSVFNSLTLTDFAAVSVV